MVGFILSLLRTVTLQKHGIFCSSPLRGLEPCVGADGGGGRAICRRHNYPPQRTMDGGVCLRPRDGVCLLTVPTYIHNETVEGARSGDPGHNMD